jgi:hypothetical protein
VLVTVKKNGRNGVAPISPPGESRKDLTSGVHEGLPPDNVESILEIDLQQCEIGPGMTMKDIPKGVGDHLDPTRTPHAVVAALKGRCNIVLPRNAKALGDKTTQGIAAAQRTDGCSRLPKSN